MGKASEQFDEQGREKCKCRKCGRFYHRLDEHVKHRHSWTVEEYQNKYPGAPVLSEAAKLREAVAKKSIVIEEDSLEDTNELIFGCVRINITPEEELTDTDKKWIPQHDEDWIVGKSEEENLEALALAMHDDENVLIVGPPGVGKTTLVRQFGAMSNWPVRRLPFNGEMRVSHLVGQKEVDIDAKTGQGITRHTKGPFIDAAECGHIVLADEFDSAPPHVMFAMHSALEKPRQLTLYEESGRQALFSDRFRFVATANTLGYGDETGLYNGTGPLNEALLDRFGMVIKINYPRKEDEARILVTKGGVEASVAEKMVALANEVRESQKRDQTLVSLSPRRLIMWADKAVKLGDVRRAARLCILNKIPPDDSTFIGGLIQRHFGGVI